MPPLIIHPIIRTMNRLEIRISARTAAARTATTMTIRRSPSSIVSFDAPEAALPGGSAEARLIFRPTLVDNPRDAAAAVNGAFVWQRKKKADQWESATEVPLSSLKSGEGFQLELHSSEVLTLFTRLAQLYEFVKAEGVPSGIQEWLTLPRSKVVSGVKEILEDRNTPPETAGLLQAFVEWLGRQSIRDLADQLEPWGAEALISFDAAVAAARLRAFVLEARTMKNATELQWQTRLREQSWVISQLYAYPFVIVGGQAYVGGKAVTNLGGNPRRLCLSQQSDAQHAVGRNKDTENSASTFRAVSEQRLCTQ